MKKFLMAAAAGAMMFGATGAYAQNGDWYVTGQGEEMRVMGGDNAEGAPVIGDDTYAMPSDCPEGSYYRSAENTLTACGEGGASFDLAAPESGGTMSSGDAWPEGSMIMTPRESGDNKQAN